MYPRAVIMAALASALLAGGAQAADRAYGNYPAAGANTGAAARPGNFYLGLTGGVVAPVDTGFSASSSQNGMTVSGSGKFSYETGYTFGGLAGFKFNKYFRGEAELSYAEADYKDVSGNFTASQGGSSVTVSGSVPLKGQVDTWLGLTRAVVSPLGDARLRPLLGGGVGFAAHESKITQVGSTSVSSTTSGTDLALEGMAGLEFSVTPKLDVGARYRYDWIGSGQNGVEDFTAHSFTGTVSYKF